METKELIFNNQKYWQNDSQPLLGKKAVKSTTQPVKMYYIDDWNPGMLAPLGTYSLNADADNSYPQRTLIGKFTAQIIGVGDFLVETSYQTLGPGATRDRFICLYSKESLSTNDGQVNGGFLSWVKLSEFLQNGGGIA